MMLMFDRDALRSLNLRTLKQQRLVLWIMAFLLLLSGISCLTRPLISGVALSLVIGISLLLGGISLIVGMLLHRTQPLWPRLSGVVLGLAYLMLAYLFIVHPAAGLVGLAAFLAFLFTFGGVVRLWLGARHLRGGTGWLHIFVGALDLVIAYLLFTADPATSIAMLMTLVGIELLFSACYGFVLASQVSAVLNEKNTTAGVH